jgi:uncharacterized protein (DUF362 family)
MSKLNLDRRAFIRLSLLGGIGAGLVYIQHQTAGMGTLNFIRWSLRGQEQKLKPAAIVGLGKSSGYDEDLVSRIRDLWDISEMPDLNGKSILVKPNLIDESDNNLSITNPKFVGAVLAVLGEFGAAKVIVGDGSAFRRDTYTVAKNSGLIQELDAQGVPFVDLNYDELVAVKARDGWIRNTDVLWLPRHVIEADYILSVPKLKAHHWSGVTLSLKNLLGILPGSRYGWPKNIIHVNGISSIILGLYQSLPPVISIIDGIVGMEGNGPLFGKPVQHGLLAAGSDPLAVDIICAQLMGFSIDKIPYLSGAAFAGIGQASRIETRGVPPDQLQQHYELPPNF